MCLRKLLDYFLVGDVCLGGRDEYQSNCPHTTAQCCGSTVLSPVSADQFKRLFLMLVSYQSSLESPCGHQFKKCTVPWRSAAFSFCAILPYERVATLYVLCFLCIQTKALSVCQV